MNVNFHNTYAMNKSLLFFWIPVVVALVGLLAKACN